MVALRIVEPSTIVGEDFVLHLIMLCEKLCAICQSCWQSEANISSSFFHEKPHAAPKVNSL